ncbi:MAG: hypothetical protein LBC87_11775 [Fibromonadaceae bacterium]|nr:hypothetical protein [Fibromonadaceae bacterium]
MLEKSICPDIPGIWLKCSVKSKRSPAASSSFCTEATRGFCHAPLPPTTVALPKCFAFERILTTTSSKSP